MVLLTPGERVPETERTITRFKKKKGRKKKKRTEIRYTLSINSFRFHTVGGLVALFAKYEVWFTHLSILFQH